MEAQTVYATPPSEYTFSEHETPSLPLGKEYKLKMVNMNGVDIAAFTVDGEDLLCFPQVYDYFLKDLVSGMHTVYTKLKRMNIQGINCNVEQVRMMRSVGAIGQVVNRCKLISKEDFNKIYEDCVLYRGPGRRKKNPDIPPELLNNPFKHFKVDHALKQENVSMDTDDGKESHDSNNNTVGERAFKMPISHHVTSPRHSNHRASASPTGSHPMGNHGSSTHSPAFSFSSRSAASLSNLPTMVNMRTHIPMHSNPSPTLSLSSQPNHSPTIHTTHSPVRTIGDTIIVEPSVAHVSSTGTSEHVEHVTRGNVTSDAGSDLSTSSPRVTSREMELGREPGSIESLLLNIQGLLNVAAENARQQQRQAHLEKEELRRLLSGEREALQKSKREKAFLQKKLKREKKAKKKLNEKLLEEQQRCLLLEQELRGSSQEAMKQMNESLINELDKERSAKGEAERKLQEARGEIQNFMQNFLENPGTLRPQPNPEGDIVLVEPELNVKEEQMNEH